MKKVFALLTIVSVMSFVACKSKPAHDAAADSARIADSIKHVEDSVAAATKAAEEAAMQANDSNATDSGAAKAAEGEHKAAH